MGQVSRVPEWYQDRFSGADLQIGDPDWSWVWGFGVPAGLGVETQALVFGWCSEPVLGYKRETLLLGHRIRSISGYKGLRV